MTLTLQTRADIDLNAVQRVAWNGEGVTIAESALQRMNFCRESFLRLLEEPDVVIYGVTSGYGQRARLRYSLEQRKQHAAKPPLPPAVSFGAPLPQRVTRAIVLARLSNFLDGYAAISPLVARAVAAMLDQRQLPTVPVRGNGGAGEIVALGHLFGPMATKLSLQEKDALCLVNGSPCAAALVADAALTSVNRLILVEQVFALSCEAIKMPLEHIDEVLETLWEDEHEAAALASLRALLKGCSQQRRPYQAPVSWRIVPRMLGRLRRAIGQAQHAANVSLRAVSDNPVYIPPNERHPNGRILSNGGYHNAMAWPALDELAASYADLCTLADRHCAKLLDGASSLLPDQLIVDDNVMPYLGCVPMAVVGYGEAARHAAQRTFMPGSESGGYGQNDVAQPNFFAWERQDEAGRMLDAATASLAFIASQAFYATERSAPPALQELFDGIRRIAPPVVELCATGPEIGRIATYFDNLIYAADTDRFVR